MRTLAAKPSTGEILVGGDACDVVHSLQAGARTSGLTITEVVAAESPASVVVLAMAADARHSVLSTASRFYRAFGAAVASDAVSIVVVQNGRPRLSASRMQKLLAAEVLFQVAAARTAHDFAIRRRTVRELLGHTALENAGVRVIRMR
jgi:hypothetical protein